MRIHAKKSLGQNFLKSRTVVADIVRAADLKRSDTILEIGPGKGILTGALLSSGANVVAVEKDRKLFDFLREEFSVEIRAGQLNLVEGDALNLQPTTYNLQPGFYKLVANIPYNITGEILRKFIGGETKPALAVLLVQKEVAERIVTRGGKESVLSISVKAYGEPKYVKKVPAKYFSPEPKVDSAILLIADIKDRFSNKDEERRFFETVKAGFAHKRKMLYGNLKIFLAGESLRETFKECGVGEKSRAEEIPLEKWLCLSRIR